MRKRQVAVLAIIPATVIAAWILPSTPLGARFAGRFAAERDIAAGRLCVKEYGELPPPWYATFIRLLKDRYGIEVEDVGGCVISETLAAHVKGYNEAMTKEIFRRFGEDVMAKTAKEVQAH